MATYLQTTATECGLACLGFIAANHGHVFEMSELRRRFAVSIRSASLADLVCFSSLLGILGKQVRPMHLE